MSHFARASIHKPVISYDKKYKTRDLETVTLRQDYDNGSHKKKYCILFTGAEGVEGLLQVKERFDTISETLDFNRRKFDSGKQKETRVPISSRTRNVIEKC